MSDQMEPDPLTSESIQASGRRIAKGCVWNCGCERRGKRFFLCSYHEGFEAGLECVRSVPQTSRSMKVYLGVHHDRLGPHVVASVDLADVERLDFTPWDAYEINTGLLSIDWVSGRASDAYPSGSDDQAVKATSC